MAPLKHSSPKKKSSNKNSHLPPPSNTQPHSQNEQARPRRPDSPRPAHLAVVPGQAEASSHHFQFRRLRPSPVPVSQQPKEDDNEEDDEEKPEDVLLVKTEGSNDAMGVAISGLEPDGSSPEPEELNTGDVVQAVPDVQQAESGKNEIQESDTMKTVNEAGEGARQKGKKVTFIEQVTTFPELALILGNSDTVVEKEVGDTTLDILENEILGKLAPFNYGDGATHASATPDLADVPITNTEASVHGMDVDLEQKPITMSPVLVHSNTDTAHSYNLNNGSTMQVEGALQPDSSSWQNTQSPHAQVDVNLAQPSEDFLGPSYNIELNTDFGSPTNTAEVREAGYINTAQFTQSQDTTLLDADVASQGISDQQAADTLMSLTHDQPGVQGGLYSPKTEAFPKKKNSSDRETIVCAGDAKDVDLHDFSLTSAGDSEQPPKSTTTTTSRGRKRTTRAKSEAPSSSVLSDASDAATAAAAGQGPRRRRAKPAGVFVESGQEDDGDNGDYSQAGSRPPKRRCPGSSRSPTTDKPPASATAEAKPSKSKSKEDGDISRFFAASAAAAATSAGRKKAGAATPKLAVTEGSTVDDDDSVANDVLPAMPSARSVKSDNSVEQVPRHIATDPAEWHFSDTSNDEPQVTGYNRVAGRDDDQYNDMYMSYGSDLQSIEPPEEEEEEEEGTTASQLQSLSSLLDRLRQENGSLRPEALALLQPFVEEDRLVIAPISLPDPCQILAVLLTCYSKSSLSNGMYFNEDSLDFSHNKKPNQAQPLTGTDANRKNGQLDNNTLPDHTSSLAPEAMMPVANSPLHDFYKRDRELIRLERPFVTNPRVKLVRARRRNALTTPNVPSASMASSQGERLATSFSDQLGNTGAATTIAKTREENCIVIDSSDDEGELGEREQGSGPGSKAGAKSSSRRDRAGGSGTILPGDRSSSTQPSKNGAGSGALATMHQDRTETRYQLSTPRAGTGTGGMTDYEQRIGLHLERYRHDLNASSLPMASHVIGNVLNLETWAATRLHDEQDTLRGFIRRSDAVGASSANGGYKVLKGFPLVEDVDFVVPHNLANPDGDCYWRAVSFCLHGTSSHFDTVKAEHLAYMHCVLADPTHPRHDLYKGTLNNKLFSVASPKGGLKANLLQLLHMPHTWTPAAMQQITADLYNIMLVTFSQVKEVVTEVSTRGVYNSRHIFMRFVDDCHFTPMFPNDFMPWEFRYPRPTVESTAQFISAPKARSTKEARQHPWRIEYTIEVMPPVPRLHGCPVNKIRQYMRAQQ